MRKKIQHLKQIPQKQRRRKEVEEEEEEGEEEEVKNPKNRHI